MVEADIHHRPSLQTSILYIQRSVCATGMLSQGHMCASLYHSTGQVGPRFGKSGSLVEWKKYHIVMFEVDTTMCLRHWHVVSRVYGGTLIPFHWQNWSQIWKFRVTCWWSQNNALALWLRLKTTSVMGHGIGGKYIPIYMVWLAESQSLE
jgi:hypothetical protein